MKTTSRFIIHIIYILMAVITLAVISVSPSYADTHSAVIKYDPEGLTLDETTYSIYKVGTFGKNGTFSFIDPYADDILEVPNYKEDDADWSQKWLDSAKTVADYIRQNGIEPLDTGTYDDEKSRAGFTFDGLENGFYIVTGTSTKKKDDKTGKVTYYWPRPMYIRILNDDPEYELKPAQGTAGILRVCKQWVGDDSEKKKTRPDEITLKVSYDGEERKTIILPHNGKWYYEWETEMGEDDPEKWVVTEVREGKVKQYYIVRDSDKFILKDGVMLKTITNTVKDSAMEPVEYDPEDKGSDTKTGDFNHIM